MISHRLSRGEEKWLHPRASVAGGDVEKGQQLVRHYRRGGDTSKRWRDDVRKREHVRVGIWVKERESNHGPNRKGRGKWAP